MSTLYDFEAKNIQGEATGLDKYRGKAVLIVNVASKCGFTNQYDGLQKLYTENQAKGLEVLGFPCNQFGSQEPGTESEIQEFCRMNYGVSFDMFEKVDVKGGDAHPVYQWLTGSESVKPGDVQWNFEKFLIDREGKLVERFSSRVKPDGKNMAEAINGVL